MISICWTCGGIGRYLEGDAQRAIQCFSCEVTEAVDEADFDE